jgi:hypothetical protein
MPQIKYVTRSASADGNHEPGDVVNVSTEAAELLVAAGSAVLVGSPVKPAAAAAPAPETRTTRTRTQPQTADRKDA